MWIFNFPRYVAMRVCLCFFLILGLKFVHLWDLMLKCQPLMCFDSQASLWCIFRCCHVGKDLTTVVLVVLTVVKYLHTMHKFPNLLLLITELLIVYNYFFHEWFNWIHFECLYHAWINNESCAHGYQFSASFPFIHIPCRMLFCHILC